MAFFKITVTQAETWIHR